MTQPKLHENICCQSISKVKDKCGSEPKKDCIIDVDGFQEVCLNVHVLETAWKIYKEQYRNPYEGPGHKRMRHVAYRQFVYWIWRHMGRKKRTIFPSCVVAKIRNSFPEASYTGFLEVSEDSD